MEAEVSFPFSMTCANDTVLPTSVYSVSSVETVLQKSQPPILIIRADGKVPTGGWSQAELVPRVYVVPPADGIWDFDFVALPPAPGTIVTQAFDDVCATYAWNDPPAYLRGVRVHARTNVQESVFSETAPVPDGPAPIDHSKLRLSIKVPDTIWINKEPIVPPNLPVPVKVDLALSNGSGETQSLFAPTPCDIFNWVVETEDGQVVQREPAVFCIQVVQHEEIGPRQIIPATETIVLDGHQFSTGTYVLKVSFWGVEGSIKLNIQEAV